MGERQEVAPQNDAAGLSNEHEVGTGSSLDGHAIDCESAMPVGRPKGRDSEVAIDFVVAVSELILTDPNASPTTIGYDLDGLCTCQGTSRQSCQRPSWASSPACDGPGGRDNQTGVFLQDIAELSGEWMNPNEELRKGDWGVILRVRGYNGSANDPLVQLDWYEPDFFDQRIDGVVPKWDGNDAWPIRTTCLAKDAQGNPDLERPTSTDRLAYVAGGVLVGSLPLAKFGLRAGTWDLSGAYITANVRRSEMDRWFLSDLTLVARWSVQSALALLSRTHDPIFKQYICTDNPVYGSFKAKICSYVDLTLDQGAPTETCNAMSFAVRMQTMPAKLGIVVTPGVGPDDSCAPDVDPRNDSCDNL